MTIHIRLKKFVGANLGRQRISKSITALLVLIFLQPMQPVVPISSASAATTGSNNCLTTVTNNAGITVTDYTSTTGYCLLKFTTSGTITMTAPSRISDLTLLVVGGGGGGGFNAGEGGGGGAIIYGEARAVGVQSFEITVGAGGNGGANSSGNYSGKSGNSSSVISNDGTIDVRAGGGGGGATRYVTGCATTGTESASSNDGGALLSSTGLNVISSTSGAKGAIFAASNITPTAGIVGTSIAFPNSLIYGSSGGAGRLTGSPGGSSGGNGAGAGGAHNVNGTSAGANQGAGGGGGGSNCKIGGNGGSGIVYLSYKVANRDSTGICEVTAFSTLDLTSATNFEVRKVEDDCIAIFKGTGSYTFFRGEASIYEYLIVAGGGSGGTFVGGGGGGGGVLSGNFINSSTATLNIIVGAGGAAKAGNATGNSGAASSALGFTAIGGGAGAAWQGGSGLSGGSGGGAGGFSAGSQGNGGSASAGQGNAGGATIKGRPTDFTAGAGGGGAGSVGGNSSNVIDAGGDGGDGVASEILGSTYYFGGGGGGGSYCDPGRTECSSGKRPGNGGIGGGGGGSAWTSSEQSYGFGGGSALNSGSDAGAASISAKGGNGGTNTGGGGGGSGHNAGSGAGGSGIVVLKWASQPSVLNFQDNSADSGSVPTNLSYWPGSTNAITIPDNSGNLAKTGKFFAGWNTNADSSGDYFLPSDQFFSLQPSQTLYAIFRYRVSFSLNDGSGQAPTPIIPATGVATLPSMLGSTKDGNPFLGWCDVAVGSVNCIGSNRTFTPTGNTTLYALYGPPVSISPIETQTTIEQIWGYTETLTATGGFGVKTFTVSSPSTRGLSVAASIIPNKNAIRVSPTVFAETYTAVIVAIDELGNKGYETTTIVVQKPGQLVPVSRNLQATVGTAKTFDIPVLGGIGNLTTTISVTGPGDTSTISLGAPEFLDGNLNLNVSNQTRPGQYQIEILLTDDSGLSKRTTFSLDVKPEISLSYQAAPSAISQESLTVQWQISPLNNYLSSGTYLNDLAGNSNATIRGPSTTPSPLIFSGQDPLYLVGDPSYLQLSANGFIASNQPLISDIATSYSLFTWVYPQGSGSLISLCDSNKCDTNSRTSIMELSSLGILSLRTPKSVAVETETALTLNRWHYVGFTIDSETSIMSVYVNDQHLGDQPVENISGSSRPYIALGASAIDSMTATNAGLGQFRFGALHLYSRALDSQAVLANFDATKDGYINVVSQRVALTTTEGVTKEFGPFRAALGSGTKTFALSGTQSGKLSLNLIDSATITLLISPSLASIDSVTAANYYETITVTDGAGVSAVLPLEIVVNPPLQIVAASETMTAKNGSTQNIEVNVQQGTGSRTLTLTSSPSSTAFSLTTSEDSRRFFTYDGSPISGTFIETITVTDEAGATSFETITVEGVTTFKLRLSTSSQISISPDQSETVTITVDGGLGPYTFERDIYSGRDSLPIEFVTSIESATLQISSGIPSGTVLTEVITSTDSLGNVATSTIEIRFIESFDLLGPIEVATTQLPSNNSGDGQGLDIYLKNGLLDTSTTNGVSGVGREAANTKPDIKDSALCSYVGAINISAGNNGFSCGISRPTTSADYFTMYAEGFYRAPVTGAITFGFSNDDSVYMEMITPSGTQTFYAMCCSVNSVNDTQFVNLEAGQLYPIKMWFIEFAGGAYVNMYDSWVNQQGTSQARTIVPISRLYSNNFDFEVLDLAEFSVGKNQPSSFTFSLSGSNSGLKLSELTGQTTKLQSTEMAYATNSTTPTSFYETITAINSLGMSVSKLVRVTINPPIIIESTFESITVAFGQTRTETITALYGTGNASFTFENYINYDYSNDPTVGGYVGENQTLTLAAPAGYTFASVQFASFGNTADKSYTIGSCHQILSVEKVTAAFIGKTTGSIAATNAFFGNPCGGTGKRLGVRLSYLPTQNYPLNLSTRSIFGSPINDRQAILTISGSTLPGTYFESVTATDLMGSQTSRTLIINVSTGVSTRPLLNGPLSYLGNAGSPFVSDTYTVTGGTAPYTFSLVSGNEFEITSLGSSEGTQLRISSKEALNAGSYSFELQVSDANGMTFSIDVPVSLQATQVLGSFEKIVTTYGSPSFQKVESPEQNPVSTRSGFYPLNQGLELDSSQYSSDRTVGISTSATLKADTYTVTIQNRTDLSANDTLAFLTNNSSGFYTEPIAASAQLSSASAMRFGPDGQLYFLESKSLTPSYLYGTSAGNAALRKIDLSTGVITTVIAPSSGLCNPMGFDFDAQGDIYISDRIWANCSSISNILLSQTGWAIRKFNISTSILSDFKSGTDTVNNWIFDLLLDSNNNRLYFSRFGNQGNGFGLSFINMSDSEKSIIEIPFAAKYNGSGADTRLSEGPSSEVSLLQPARMAFSPSDGALYFADKNWVRRYDTSTGSVSIFAGSSSTSTTGDGGSADQAGFEDAFGLAFSTNGDLYVSDYDQIRKISAATGIITTVAGGNGAATEGNFGDALFGKMERSLAMTASSNGDLYFVSKCGIRKLSNGIFLPVAGISNICGYTGDTGLLSAATTKMTKSRAIAISPSGSVVFADLFNHRIRAISNGNYVKTIAGNGAATEPVLGWDATLTSIADPYSLAYDLAGNLYVGLTKPRILKIDSSGIVSLIAGASWSSTTNTGDGGLATNANLQGPIEGISIDKSTGDIYFIAHQTIRKIDQAGIISTLPIAGMSNPYALIVSDSKIYVSDYDQHCIRVYEIASRTLTTYAGVCSSSGSSTGFRTSAKFKNPTGMFMDSFGDLYIADSNNKTIRVINAYDGIVSTITLSPDKIVMDLVGDENGDLYIVQFDDGGIRKLDRKLLNNFITLVVEKSPANLSIDLISTVDESSLVYGEPYSLVISTVPKNGTLNLRLLDGETGFDSIDCNDITILETTGDVICQWIPNSATASTVEVKFSPQDTVNYTETSQTRTFAVSKAESFTVTFIDSEYKLGDNFPSVYSISGLVPIDSLEDLDLRFESISSGQQYDSESFPGLPGNYRVSVNPANPNPFTFEINDFGYRSKVTNYLGYRSNSATLLIEKGVKPPQPIYGGNNQIYLNPGSFSLPVLPSYMSRFTLDFSTTSNLVCTISDPRTGAVTTNATGYCDITLRVVDSDFNEYFENNTVNVSVQITKAPRAITLSTLPSSMKYGQTLAFDVILSAGEDDGEIYYDSILGSICTVDLDRGLIGAKKGSGTCSITIGVRNGSNYQDARTTVNITLTKADAPQITIPQIKSIEYSGSAISAPGPLQIFGLVNGDQVIANPTYTYTGGATSPPLQGGSYSATLRTLTLTGSLDISLNYNVAFPSVSFAIFPVEQPAFSILTEVAFVGVATTLSYSVANLSTATPTYTVVSGGTASGCSATNGNIFATSTGTCLVKVMRTANSNYKAVESAVKTVTIKKLEQTVATQQLAPTPQETITIGIKGGTGLDKGSAACTAACVPTITSISPGSLAPLSLLTITGTNFNTATEVIFNRKYRTTTLQVNSDTEIVVQIPAEVPVGAGSLSVVASGGTSFRFSELTITP